MANGAFKFKDNSGNVVSFISGSGSNILFSGGTLDLSGMTGLTLGNLTLSGTTQNALSASHAASYLLTSSFNTYTGDTNTIIGTLATTGSNLFKGDQTFSGSLIPSTNALYDLGDPTHHFRHLYLSSASLYIDGTKVLGSTAQELQITTDTGQSFKILEAGSDNITLQSADGNIELKTSGGGDVIMDPTTGVIALKGTTTLYAGNKLLSSDGNAIQVGNSLTVTGSMIVTGYIETQELRTTYISSSILYRSGSTKFGDELTDTHSFTGSLSVSGTISVPESGLISGSSQLTGSYDTRYVLSGSITQTTWDNIASKPSGIVSGSVQVDVMSTTNISRLATTGSNTFTSNQIVTGSILITGSINVTGSLLTTGSSVGIGGQANPARTLHVMGQGAFDMTHAGVVIQDSISPMTASQIVSYKQTNAVGSAYRNMHLRADVLGIAIMSGSGYVSIGKDSANSMLDINGNTLVSGSLTTTGIVSINSPSTTQLNIYTSSVSTQNVMGEFWNGDYTSGTRNFIRVRNAVNAGSTMSSYFGQGQDGKTYIVSNDFTKNHIVIDGNSAYVGINKNTPNSQLDVNGNATVTGSLVTTSNVTIGTTNSGQPTMYLTRVGGFPTIKGSTVNGGDGQIVIDGASNSSNVYLNNYVSSNVYLATGGGTTHSGLLIPHSNATFDLGSSANRWATVYTSDLSMSNGIGDYTIVEGLEDLFLYNNKTNKVFKFMLQEVDPSTATPKKS